MHLKLSCIPEVVTDAGFYWSLSCPQLCYLINSELRSWNGSLHRYHLLGSLTGLLKQALPAFQMDPVSIFFCGIKWLISKAEQPSRHELLSYHMDAWLLQAVIFPPTPIIGPIQSCKILWQAFKLRDKQWAEVANPPKWALLLPSLKFLLASDTELVNAK